MLCADGSRSKATASELLFRGFSNKKKLFKPDLIKNFFQDKGSDHISVYWFITTILFIFIADNYPGFFLVIMIGYFIKDTDAGQCLFQRFIC